VSLPVPATDVVALAPVLAPAAGIVVLLLLDAVAGGRWPVPLARIHDVLALAALAAAGGAVLWLAARGGERATLCIPGEGLTPPSCSYVSSGLTLALQGIVVAGALVSLLLALDGSGASERTGHHLLLLTATAGALALAGVRDLASLAVALEVATLPAVALVALRRDARGAQAALTMLLTAVTSLAVLLLGVALLLLATGTLWLDRTGVVLGAAGLPGSVRLVAMLGLGLVVAGIGFKASLVPFHLWTPDTYAGAPLPVAAFLSVVSKAAAIAALLVVLGVGLPGQRGVWAPVIGVVAAVTMTVGNLVALRQRGAVRLLAWSTVAQAGWVVLPLAGVLARHGGRSGIGQSTAVLGVARQAVSASLGYLAAYTAASLAAFGVVTVLARHHPDGERHSLDAYRGLARREPVAAAVLGFALACLAGLPPGLVGVVAKLLALRPLVDAGWWLLAVIAAGNVVLGAAYYLRWGALLVARAGPGEPVTWRLRPAEALALGTATAACLLLSVAPQLISDLSPGLLR
jgi:NADH-quinone oxidoreductase subunit N